MLLYQLEKLESLKSGEAQSLAIYLYQASKTFRELVDIAYDDNLAAFFSDETMPVYKQDSVPVGFNLVRIESQLRKIRRILFFADGDVYITEARRIELAVQIFESLSAVENRFLMQVMDRSITHLPQSEWEKLKNANV